MKKFLPTIAMSIFAIVAMAQTETKNGFYYSPQGFKICVGKAKNSKVSSSEHSYSGLYSADGKTLLKANKGYYNENTYYYCVINGTEAIGSYAFSNCAANGDTYFRTISIYIPSSVKYIAPDAFNCLNPNIIINIAGIYDDCINTTASLAPVVYSPQEVEEIARYNIQGMKVDEDAEGVQIIRYNDGSSKKILNK